PLQMSSWTTTVPYSVRNSAPVGHTSKHPAWVQCLHTSEDMSHRNSSVSGGRRSAGLPFSPSCAWGSASRSTPPVSRSCGGRLGILGLTSLWPLSRAAAIRSASCSMNGTCRHVFDPSAPESSYEEASSPSESAGSSFHSSHATSQALQPMQMEVSVKKPVRASPPVHPESAAGLADPKNWPITLSFRGSY